MNSLSNVEEIKKRGEIYEIDKSTIRANVFIVSFVDGSQANVNGETMNLITKNK